MKDQITPQTKPAQPKKHIFSEVMPNTRFFSPRTSQNPCYRLQRPIMIRDHGLPMTVNAVSTGEIVQHLLFEDKETITFQPTTVEKTERLSEADLQAVFAESIKNSQKVFPLPQDVMVVEGPNERRVGAVKLGPVTHLSRAACATH